MFSMSEPWIVWVYQSDYGDWKFQAFATKDEAVAFYASKVGSGVETVITTLCQIRFDAVPFPRGGYAGDEQQ